MIKRLSMRILLLLVLSLLPMCAARAQVAPSDFAYGVEVTLGGDGPIYRVAVPPDVYRSALRDDLGDLRVFNGAGEPVPHAVHRPAISGGETRSLRLPFYALSDTARAADPDVLIRRDADGAVITIVPRSAQAQQPRIAYLLDTRATDRPIRSLTLYWDDAAPDFVTSVQIATSTDLARWRPSVRDAAIADLQQGGQRLVRRTVALGASVTSPFLRIMARDGETMPLLTRVEAEVVEAEVPVERSWRSADLVDAEASTYTFDLGAKPPADAARIRLPEVNTLAQASLASAGTPDGPWRTQASGALYRLSVDGTELSTPDFSFRPTRDRYWRLTVEPDGALGSQPPELEIGYVPETVLFIARGEGPFRIAFGSRAAEPAALPPSTLLGSAPGGESALVSPAGIGESFELGGSAALHLADGVDTRRATLWAVLLLGVALLGWMAWQLFRQIQAEPSE